MKNLLSIAALVIASALGVVALAFYNTWNVHHMDIVVWAASLTCLAIPLCAAIATYLIVRARLDDKAEASREKQIIAMLQEQRHLGIAALNTQRQDTEGLRQERMGRLLAAGQPQQIAAPVNFWAPDLDDDGGSPEPLQL